MFKDLTTDQKRQVIALAMEQGITDVDQIAQIYDAQEAQQKEKSNPYTQLYEEDLESALAQSYNPAVANNPYEEVYANQYGNEDIVADEDVNMYAKGGKIFNSVQDLIKFNEGFVPNWMKDGKGVAIGYGFNTLSGLISPSKINSLTREQADQLLNNTFLPYVTNMIRNKVGSHWNKLTPGQQAALIDLTYQRPGWGYDAAARIKAGDMQGARALLSRSKYVNRGKYRQAVWDGNFANGRPINISNSVDYSYASKGNTPSYNSYSSSANSTSNSTSSPSDTGWASLFGGSQNSTMGTISEEQFNNVIKNGYQALAAKNGDNGIDTTKQAEVDKTHQTAYDNLFKEVEEHNNSKVEGNSLLDAAALLFNSRARRSGREGIVDAYIPKKDVLYDDVINNGIQNYLELPRYFTYGGNLFYPGGVMDKRDPNTDDNNPYDVFNQKERSHYLGNGSWGFVNLADNTGEFNSYVKDNVGNVFAGLSGEAHRDYPGAPFIGLLPTATVTAQRDHFDPIKGKFNYKPLTVEEEKSIEDNIKGRNNLIKSGRVDIVSPEFYLLAGTAGLGVKNVGNAAKGALNTVGKYSTPSTWTNALTRFKPTQGQLMELARSPYGIAGGGIYSSPLLGTPTNAVGLLADTAAYGLGIEELYKGAQAIDKAVGKPSLGNVGNAAVEGGLGLAGMIPVFGSTTNTKALNTLMQKAGTSSPADLANLLGIFEKLPKGAQRRLVEIVMKKSSDQDFTKTIPRAVGEFAEDPIKNGLWALTGNSLFKPKMGEYAGTISGVKDVHKINIIDGYLYNADLSVPGLIKRVKVNSLQDYGPHAEYIEKNYPHLIGKIPIYDIKQGKMPIEEEVRPITEFISNMGKFSDSQRDALEYRLGIDFPSRNILGSNYNYNILPITHRTGYDDLEGLYRTFGFKEHSGRNSFPLYYNPIDIAGHLVQFGMGANSKLPYIRHQDIWKFLGPDYLKKWYGDVKNFYIPGNKYSEEEKKAIMRMLDIVNGIGTPIVFRGGWSHKYGGNLNRNSYAKGGSLIDPPSYLYQRPGYKDWLKTVPKDRISNNYDLQLAYNLEDPAQLEKWRTATIQQLKNPAYHLHSVYMDPRTGYGYFAKLGDEYSNPEYKDEKNWYFSSDPEAKDFRTNYQLIEDGKRSYYRLRFAPYLVNKK